MNPRRGALALLIVVAFGTGCGSGTPPIALPNTSAPYLKATGPNVLPLVVGASAVCGRSNYQNEPCTSVTICVPGSAGESECQTVSDILVDTGSVGLRVFSALLHLTLPPVTASGGRTLTECAQFGTGSDWGPIVTAEVVLGSEPAVTTPIQLIEPGVASPPPGCAGSDTSPAQAGYNGILGVGLFRQDCGDGCSDPSNGSYFACSAGGACSGVGATLAQQPQNPVSLLPADNNGLLLALPQVDSNGTPAASGVMILGIGTAANNGPIGVSAYPADPSGNFITTFQNNDYTGSFVDSGSNALYFPNLTGLSLCSPGGSSSGAIGESFYCPSGVQTLQAAVSGALGNPRASIPFQVGNAGKLTASSGLLGFSDLAGSASQMFDWGLPFFYGRAVFTGIEASSSSLGKGPLWGF